MTLPKNKNKRMLVKLDLTIKFVFPNLATTNISCFILTFFDCRPK